VKVSTGIDNMDISRNDYSLDDHIVPEIRGSEAKMNRNSIIMETLD